MKKKKIYKEIAKKNGVTWQEVRDDIQSALNHAYTDPNKNILNIVCQKDVERSGEIPSVEEFIYHVEKKIKAENQDVERRRT